MRVRLTDEMIRTNSGGDLWDYLFEGVPLPKRITDSISEEEKWKSEGIEWVESLLLEDEEYQILETDDRYAYTSKGRVFNLKYKNKIKLMKYVGSLRCHMGKKTHNMNKLIKDKWGEDVTYETLCKEAKEMVTQIDMSSSRRK